MVDGCAAETLWTSYPQLAKSFHKRPESFLTAFAVTIWRAEGTTKAARGSHRACARLN